MTVAAKFPDLVHALNWNTDASAAYVLAERLRGHGPVSIPHFGWWTSMWGLLATRDLPGHAELWEVTGYAFAVAGAGLVGWATSRLAGRWAGVTAAATALVVGPFALRTLLTVNFHVSTPFAAAVLAAYLVLLAERRSRALAVGVGLFAGLSAASDPLLWIAGVAPFAIAAALLTASAKRRDIAARASIVLGVAVLSAVVTNELMGRLGFQLVSTNFRFSSPTALPSNVLHLGRVVALLGGANYALPGGYPREPVRILVALLVFVAVAAVILVAVKHVVRRAEPTAQAYACYWASAIVLLGLGFVGTTQAAAMGAGSINYLLTVALAAGAGVALLAAGSRRGQVAVALAVAAVGAVNIAGILDGRAGTASSAINTYERPLIRLLEQKGVTRGYAGYWDAQSLTWQSGMRLLVAPIDRCDLPSKPRLCGSTFFVISSWYKEKPGPSFLLVDPERTNIKEPPPVVSDAFATYRFGPITVYLFRYDLARQIRDRTQ